MAQVAVVGAGVSGLAACVALARDGHQITLFERDPLELAADVHEAFEADRRGAPQIRHSHAFLARVRNLLRDHYPDVLEGVRGVGLLLGLKCKVENRQLMTALRRRGLLTGPAGHNVIRVLPPLIVEPTHIAEAVAIIRETCREFSYEMCMPARA